MPTSSFCFEEYDPNKEKKGELKVSNTEIRKAKEKTAGTCPNHGKCFEEYYPKKEKKGEVKKLERQKRRQLELAHTMEIVLKNMIKMKTTR